MIKSQQSQSRKWGPQRRTNSTLHKQSKAESPIFGEKKGLSFSCFIGLFLQGDFRGTMELRHEKIVRQNLF